MKKIVIDTLLSDKGEEEIVKGVIKTFNNNNDYRFILVGNKNNILKVLEANNVLASSFDIIDAKAADLIVDNPLLYIYSHEDTSLVKACKICHEDNAAIGLISSGPTGLLLISSMVNIGLLDNVKYPSLAANLLNINNKRVCLVDCGANLDVKPSRLLTFARQGAALISSYSNIDNPRIGLLNVGKEEGKGNLQLKEAFKLLKESDLNFVGNIEGSDVFLDKVDVVVTDGYTGNVLLKNAESIGLICKKIIDLEFESETKASKTIYNMFAYTDLGAAIILGTKKIVLKAHGACNSESISNIIFDIIKLDKNNFIEKMKNNLNK